VQAHEGSGSRLRPLTEPWSWPLVGRREELALCDGWLAGDRVRGIVLSGAPGVGKTRLAREVLAAAASAGRPTAHASATRFGQAIPLGALSHLLPPKLGRSPTTLDLIGHARVLLAERFPHGRLVLGVDDGQWLDPASALLVLQLVASSGAVVVVTVTSGENVPDAVSALWKDHGCAYLELQPLSEDETRELLEFALGGQVDLRLAHAVWSACRGTPLMLRELVVESVDLGVFAEVDGVWRLRGQPGVSRRLRDIVESRIGALHTGERAALELVALGEPAALAWPEAATATDELLRRGLLEVRREGRRSELRFAHPLYAEVVRTDVPPAHAAAIQGRLADLLESTGARRRGDLLRLAEWRLASGGDVAPTLLLRAATEAELAFAPALAERFAQAAEERGGGFDARYAHARALASQGRFEAAEEMLRGLEVQSTSDAERAMVVEAHARLLAGGLGRAAEAVELIEAAGSVGDRTLQARLALCKGWCVFKLGRLAEAADSVVQFVDDDAVEEHVRVSAAVFRAEMLLQLGPIDEAIAITERCLPQARRLEDDRPGTWPGVVFVHALALLFVGRMPEAESAAAALTAWASEREDLEFLGLAAWLRGVVALTRGQLHDACRAMREAAGIFREADTRGLLPWALALLAQAAGQAGAAEEARAAADEAAAVEEARSPGPWIHSASVLLGRAWASAAEGALQEARLLALSAAEARRQRGQLMAACIDLHDLARMGGAIEAAPRLTAATEQVDGAWLRACARHAAALVGGDAQELEAVGDAFEKMGALLDAAEALSEAARAHRSTGRDSSARRCAAHARTLLSLCSGASTPALATIRGLEFAELTPREREVATLASHGLSNREIAMRLVISVRTAENQLQRAYRKLGVASRSELLPLLLPQDTASME